MWIAEMEKLKEGECDSDGMRGSADGRGREMD